jgi:hypothetical protein
MALSDKKSNLTKVTTNTPVFRTGGVLSQKLSFYKPSFSTNTGVSSGAPQGVTTEAALQAPASKDTGGSNTATVAPASFRLMIGYSVQSAITESVKTVYSTNNGATWTTFESGFDLQYVPVGGEFQRVGSGMRHTVKPGDDLWIGLYKFTINSSVSSSINFAGNPGGYVYPSSSYTSSCGVTNPYKIYNISGSNSTYLASITIAVSASAVVFC